MGWFDDLVNDVENTVSDAASSQIPTRGWALISPALGISSRLAADRVKIRSRLPALIGT